MADRISIINGEAGDDTVIKNGRAVNFPVDTLLPDADIWAVQWYGDKGEIEYRTKAPKVITNLGDFTAVLVEYDRLISAEDNPPLPDLDDLKADKIIAINDAATMKIISGFVSSALGNEHSYQSDRDDQLNLVGMVAAGSDGYFKCENSEGIASYVLHNIDQLRQVLADGKKIKMDVLQRAAILKSEVYAATDIAGLASVSESFSEI